MITGNPEVPNNGPDISLDALANSSFQGNDHTNTDNDSASEFHEALSQPLAQEKVTADAGSPSTPPQSAITSSSAVLMEDVPNLNISIGTGTPNVSVIGLQPIQPSPRRAMQRLLDTPVDNKPRLVIEKLVLTNFKSYAGRQEIGPFHPSFSAVVGPNGSGKSNVIDSMLFVFGFRASKMRQSKLKELIHHSENFPDLQFCQVDIHFKKIIDNYDSEGNNTNNPTIVENSDLIVSRKATQNNSSSYYINNRNSNYKEVTTLLKDEGIDLDHKRFLILQGEVEMIAQMKPKAENDNDDGLLEYLEDIIGTSSYKERIESITSEIENLQDSYNEKERRFKFISKEFEDVEKQKDAAVKYLKLEKELKEETVKYWYLTNYSETLAMERQEVRLDELNEKIKGDKETIEKATKKLTELKQKKEKLLSDSSKINTKISNSKSQFKVMEKEQISLGENLKINEKKSDTLKKTLKSNKKTLQANEEELVEIHEKVEKYEGLILDITAQLRTETEVLNQIKAELSSETKKYSQEIGKLQKELEPWKNDLDRNQSDFRINSSKVELLRNQMISIKNEREKLSNLLSNKTEEIKINESKIEAITDKKRRFESDINKNRNTFRAAGDTLKTLQLELQDIRGKVDDAKNRVSNVESQNKVLSALTRLKETGRITGFYGKLGDLGVIDDKYDVAVSTGGGALGDFVVDTVEDAQNCIQYLRQHNLGFGKFIVLEKLKRFNLNKINTPENTPRLFDLISPVDPKFAPAFYSSMYDTLVATNLDAANRVAFGGSKRWRVVTLDGKLIDNSGTMSGGGNRVSRGAMKLASNASTYGDSVSPEQLNQWKHELNEKEEKFRTAEMQYRKMDQVLRSSEEETPRMAAEIVRLQMDNNSISEEIKELKRMLQNSNADTQETARIESEIKSLEETLGELKAERIRLEENTKDIQTRIDKLQQTILDIGGVRLKKQTAKVQELKEDLQLKIEVKEHDELRIAKMQNQNQKLKKTIVASESQFSELESLSETLRKSYQTKTKKLEVIQSDINKLEEELNKITDSVEEIDEEAEQEDADLREKSELISDTLKQIKKVEEVMKNIQVEIDHTLESLENIEYRDVEPYIIWMAADDPTREKLLQKRIDYEEKFTEDTIKQLDLKQLGEKVDSLKVELSDTTVNLDVLLAYGDKEKNYADQKQGLEDALIQLNETKEKSEELNERRHSEFKEGFHAISSTLKDMYHLITAGGTAELEYYDSHDAFSEGIVFSVMPPKKSWRTISNLSGGEKTLASLALVFALHHYKPTPLYVMDEIDAALDFKNVSIVANYIKSRTKNAQFIVISLRNNMFELAESLVGIYKVNNMTRSATLANRDLIK
jgi:structural maintenance of chromosome 4